MKFKVRFKIENRFGKGSVYSFREICVSLIDRYSLTDDEIIGIFKLNKGDNFTNCDLSINRVK